MGTIYLCHCRRHWVTTSPSHISFSYLFLVACSAKPHIFSVPFSLWVSSLLSIAVSSQTLLLLGPHPFLPPLPSPAPCFHPLPSKHKKRNPSDHVTSRPGSPLCAHLFCQELALPSLLPSLLLQSILPDQGWCPKGLMAQAESQCLEPNQGHGEERKLHQFFCHFVSYRMLITTENRLLESCLRPCFKKYTQKQKEMQK